MPLLPPDWLDDCNHHRGALNAEMVVTARQRHANKLSTVMELADAYGVAPETIRRALRGETWRHLEITPAPADSPDTAAAAQASLERFLADPTVAAAVVPAAEPVAPSPSPPAPDNVTQFAAESDAQRQSASANGRVSD